MSVRMKKRPISNASTGTITLLGKRYIAPKKTLRALLTIISSNPDFKADLTPYDEIVAEKIKKIGKGAMALKGARARDGLTQKDLSQELKIDQAIISKIEIGERKITTDLAKKLGNLFNINYKVFLR